MIPASEKDALGLRRKNKFDWKRHVNTGGGTLTLDHRLRDRGSFVHTESTGPKTADVHFWRRKVPENLLEKEPDRP